MKFGLENLRDDIRLIVKRLSNGLTQLDFIHNFPAFTQVVDIPAGEEVSVRNQLSSIPRYRIIVRQTGNGLITDGATAWDTNYIYLKNNGAEDVTATIIVFR